MTYSTRLGPSYLFFVNYYEDIMKTLLKVVLSLVVVAGLAQAAEEAKTNEMNANAATEKAAEAK